VRKEVRALGPSYEPSVLYTHQLPLIAFTALDNSLLEVHNPFSLFINIFPDYSSSSFQHFPEQGLLF
jgi:hypothetical protein